MKSTGVIFKRTIRDSRGGILGWGIGLGLLAFFEVMLFPSISEAFSGLSELLESPFYQAFLGEGADAAAFASPPGYLAIYMLAFVPLYIAFYVVLLGLNMTAGEEEHGTIDLLLGTPTPRWQVIVEKFLAAIVIITLILLLNGVFAALGVLITPEMQELSLLRLFEGTLSMLPITLLMTTIALLLSTVLSSRGRAGAITGAIIVVSYFVTNLAEIAGEALQTIKPFSFFTYYPTVTTMQDGIVWGDVLVLAVLIIVLVGLSLFFFQRRDLAV